MYKALTLNSEGTARELTSPGPLRRSMVMFKNRGYRLWQFEILLESGQSGRD